jgi:hypothetical protein
MKQLKFATAFIAVFIFTMSCNQPATGQNIRKQNRTVIKTMTKADPTKTKRGNPGFGNFLGQMLTMHVMSMHWQLFMQMTL